MTQSDLFLSNQPGASFRAELNQIIESLATNHAGLAWPSPMLPSMWWADSTASRLRRRRADNTAWIDVSPIDEALLKASNAEVAAGVEATKAVTPATLRTVSGTAHDCRFTYINAGTCRLDRYGGSLITIDAQFQTIPVGGVDLAFDGAWPDAMLYVYAYMNAGALALIASSYAYIIDARDGNRVMTGSPQYTLVGAVRTGQGSFKFASNYCGVLSAWNKTQFAFNSPAVNAATGSTVATALAWIDFISLGEDAVTGTLSGYVSNNSPGAIAHVTDPSFDSASSGAQVYGHTSTAGFCIDCGAQQSSHLAAGIHHFSPSCFVSAGVGTWNFLAFLLIRG